MKQGAGWVLAAFVVGAALGAFGGYQAGFSGRAARALGTMPQTLQREPEAPAPKASQPTAPVATPAERPKPRADVVEAAVEVSRILEPELDEAALRAALRQMADQARTALSEAKTEQEQVAALNRVLLADRQVSYISNIRWRDASLAAAALRKKGNCLATTTLYVVAGKMLDLPVHAVLLPRHAFARFDGEPPINIETTAKGKHTPDSELRFEFDFGDEDARDFAMGRSLSDDEFAAALLLEGAGHLDAVGRKGEALALVGRAEALWPNSLIAAFARAGLLYQDPARRAEALDFYQKAAQEADKRSRRTRATALGALAAHAHALGHEREALGLLRMAYSLSSRVGQDGILALMSDCFRTERDFSAAALAQELSLLRGIGNEASLDSLAIMYKNAGRLADAIRVLRLSLQVNPESWFTQLVLAGYLIRAGQEDEGWAVFAKIQAPRTDKEQYQTNLAWFYASAGKKAEFLDHLGQALALSQTPGILTYIRTEVDFDRYRSDPDFQALVEKHRARLLDGAGRKDP
jgi:tetratricopeptide (TPR) repeat protein